MKNAGLEELDLALQDARDSIAELEAERKELLSDLAGNWYYNGVRDLIVGPYTLALAIDPMSYDTQKMSIDALLDGIFSDLQRYSSEPGHTNEIAALNERKAYLEAEFAKLEELNNLIEANHQTTQEDLEKIQEKKQGLNNNAKKIEDLRSDVLQIQSSKDSSLKQSYGRDPASVKTNIGRLNTILKTPLLLRSIGLLKSTLAPVLSRILGSEATTSKLLSSLKNEVITQVLPTVIAEIDSLSLDEFKGLMNINYSDPAFIKAAIHATTKLNKTLSMDTINALKPVLEDMLGKDSMVIKIINACSDKFIGEDLNKLLVALDKLSVEDYVALLGTNYQENAFLNGKHLNEVMAAVGKLGEYFGNHSIDELRPVLNIVLQDAHYVQNILAACENKILQKNIPDLFDALGTLSAQDFDALLGNGYPEAEKFKSGKHLSDLMGAVSKLGEFLKNNSIEEMMPVLVAVLGKSEVAGLEFDWTEYDLSKLEVMDMLDSDEINAPALFVMNILQSCKDSLTKGVLPDLLASLSTLTPQDFDALLGNGYPEAEKFKSGKHLNEVMSAVSKLNGFLEKHSIEDMKPVLKAVLGEGYVMNIVEACKDSTTKDVLPDLLASLSTLTPQDFDALLGNGYPEAEKFKSGKHLNEVMSAVSKLNGFLEKHSLEDMKPVLKAVLGEGYVMNIVEACTDQVTKKTIPEVMSSLKTITPAEFDLLLSPKFDKDSLKAIIAILPKLQPVLAKDNFENLKPVLMRVFGNESTVGKLLEPLSGEVAELIFTKLQSGLGGLKDKDLEAISKYLMERDGLSKAELVKRLSGQYKKEKHEKSQEARLAAEEASRLEGLTKSEAQEELDALNLQAAMQAAAPVLEAVGGILQDEKAQLFAQKVVEEVVMAPSVSVDPVEAALQKKMDEVAKSKQAWEELNNVKKDPMFKDITDKQLRSMLSERQLRSFAMAVLPAGMGFAGSFLEKALDEKYKKDVIKLMSGASDVDMSKALLGISLALQDKALNEKYGSIAEKVNEYKPLFTNMLKDMIQENPRLNAMGFTDNNIKNLVNVMSNKDMMGKLGGFAQMAADKKYVSLVFKSIKEIGFSEEVRKLTVGVIREFLMPGFIKKMLAGTSINNTIKDCAETPDKDLGATCDNTKRTWLRGFLIKWHNFADQRITESMSGMNISSFNFSNSKFKKDGLNMSGATITNCDFSNIAVQKKGELNLYGAKIDENSLISILGAMQGGAKVNISNIEISGPISHKNAELINKALDSINLPGKAVLKGAIESIVLKQTEHGKHAAKVQSAKSVVSSDRNI